MLILVGTCGDSLRFPNPFLSGMKQSPRMPMREEAAAEVAGGASKVCEVAVVMFDNRAALTAGAAWLFGDECAAQ